jgi:hypothetical protein
MLLLNLRILIMNLIREQADERISIFNSDLGLDAKSHHHHSQHI